MQTDQGKVLAEDALAIAVLVRRSYARILAVPVVEEIFWQHINSVAGIHQSDKH
jgi:hypothetical protein